MIDESSKSVWYGYIVSSTAKTKVIFEPQMDWAPPGQIYIYNVTKGAIIKYVKELVMSKLVEMTEEERKELEEEHGEEWRKARKAFFDEHDKIFAVRGPKIAKAVPVSLDMDDSDDDLPPFDDDDTLDWDDE